MKCLQLFVQDDDMGSDFDDAGTTYKIVQNIKLSVVLKQLTIC
jgi:hypothetical protein